MNPAYGIAARRVLMENPPGAGGLAGHTVPEWDPKRVIGGTGFNAETVPVEVHDDTGALVKYPTGDGAYRPSHMEVVESWRRDPIAYPNAYSFRMNLSKPLREVFCIEIVEINLPNVDATPPVHREYLILNGTIRGANNNFTPQPELPKDRQLHTMVAHSSNDPNIDRSAAAWNNTNRPQLDDYAFGRFPYDSTKPFQYWKREGWHRKMFAPTPIRNLGALEFSVCDVYGTPYDFAASEEWSCTLQIYSKA